MRLKAKVGDKVTILPTSEFYVGVKSNPIGEIGTVTNLSPDAEYQYEVDWEGGGHNSYRNGDIKKLTKAEMDKMLPEIKPLSEFDGYTIERSRGNVSFGCGEVKVKVADLKTAAKALENDKFGTQLRSIENYKVLVNYGTITAEQLLDYAKILSDQGFQKASLVFDRLAEAAGRRKTKEQIMRIPARTLLAIAG